MSLKLTQVQKSAPQGKALENAVAAAYKELDKELTSKYPYKPEAKKMSYGSNGDAFGA